ncbi:hypothetical protein P7C73_g5879, partial [Tremellales sp. Uapishka_1]
MPPVWEGTDSDSKNEWVNRHALYPGSLPVDPDEFKEVLGFGHSGDELAVALPIKPGEHKKLSKNDAFQPSELRNLRKEEELLAHNLRKEGESLGARNLRKRGEPLARHLRKKREPLTPIEEVREKMLDLEIMIAIEQCSLTDEREHARREETEARAQRWARSTLGEPPFVQRPKPLKEKFTADVSDTAQPTSGMSLTDIMKVFPTETKYEGECPALSGQFAMVVDKEEGDSLFGSGSRVAAHLSSPLLARASSAATTKPKHTSIIPAFMAATAGEYPLATSFLLGSALTLTALAGSRTTSAILRQTRWMKGKRPAEQKVATLDTTLATRIGGLHRSLESQLREMETRILLKVEKGFEERKPAPPDTTMATRIGGLHKSLESKLQDMETRILVHVEKGLVERTPARQDTTLATRIGGLHRSLESRLQDMETRLLLKVEDRDEKATFKTRARSSPTFEEESERPSSSLKSATDAGPAKVPVKEPVSSMDKVSAGHQSRNQTASPNLDSPVRSGGAAIPPSLVDKPSPVSNQGPPSLSRGSAVKIDVNGMNAAPDTANESLDLKHGAEPGTKREPKVANEEEQAKAYEDYAKSQRTLKKKQAAQISEEALINASTTAAQGMATDESPSAPVAGSKYQKSGKAAEAPSSTTAPPSSKPIFKIPLLKSSSNPESMISGMVDSSGEWSIVLLSPMSLPSGSRMMSGLEMEVHPIQLTHAYTKRYNLKDGPSCLMAKERCVESTTGAVPVHFLSNTRALFAFDRRVYLGVREGETWTLRDYQGEAKFAQV